VSFVENNENEQLLPREVGWVSESTMQKWSNSWVSPLGVTVFTITVKFGMVQYATGPLSHTRLGPDCERGLNLTVWKISRFLPVLATHGRQHILMKLKFDT